MNIINGLSIILYAYISIYLINFSTFKVIKSNKKYFDEHLSLKNKIIIFILIKTCLLFYPFMLIQSALNTTDGEIGAFFMILFGGALMFVFFIAFKIRDLFYAKKLRKQMKNK